MPGFLEGLDLTKLLGTGEPANFAIGGGAPGGQPMTPDGMPDLSQPLPESAPQAPPPPQLNEADYLQAEGPGAGGTLLNGVGGAVPAQGGLRGLLSKLTATGADGVTFGNKINALGQILQGQGGQASAGIQQLRDNAVKQKLMQQAMASKQAQSVAFANLVKNNPRLASLGPLSEAMGSQFDLDEFSKARDLLAPKSTYMNAGSDIVETDEANPGHVLYSSHEKPPPLMKWDPITKRNVIDEDQIRAQVRAYGGKEALKRFAPTRPMYGGSFTPPGATELPD
jgi:hypothetical protein